MSISVIGIAGSLRTGSFNMALLRAAAELVPIGMTIEIAGIDSIPLYNADVDALGTPAVVQELKDKIRAADALLIATPEYNYSVPGVLKNAIDWISRNPDPPLTGKPTAIMGASVGVLGTVRAQYHLRQIGVFTNMLILNRPEVFVGRAQEKFDASGKLIDEPTRKIIGDLLIALKDWTNKVSGNQ
jgi:chromate reductase